MSFWQGIACCQLVHLMFRIIQQHRPIFQFIKNHALLQKERQTSYEIFFCGYMSRPNCSNHDVSSWKLSLIVCSIDSKHHILGFIFRLRILLLTSPTHSIYFYGDMRVLQQHENHGQGKNGTDFNHPCFWLASPGNAHITPLCPVLITTTGLEATFPEFCVIIAYSVNSRDCNESIVLSHINCCNGHCFTCKRTACSRFLPFSPSF